MSIIAQLSDPSSTRDGPRAVLATGPLPIALLIVPLLTPQFRATWPRVTQTAARKLGIKLHVLNASSEPEFDAVFATTT
jgi:hypothetical protein